ncbi:hypothetical protein Q31b_20350 [Novipirellula aureliae]|uniref:Translational regulator CsrA n=1 Tax=Novipirellula aureliae TaxID=2527966 RepID=A0A5C6E271_9BACT|nr:carbon storage regulator [Novipirellula aureliae]TWU43000.1 hypothetical protein Q31b_20350 [Novipirellula aureliae]
MLILSRKETESIRIGNDIVVIVTRIGRGRVKIGIDAPRETPIRRAELVEKPRAGETLCVPIESLTDPLGVSPLRLPSHTSAVLP